MGEEFPIIALDQMATQLSQEMPPIEDAEYKPVTIKELSASADTIAQKCPPGQIEYFYKFGSDYF